MTKDMRAMFQRLDQSAALTLALSRYRCDECQSNHPKVTKTVDDVRYVECRRCQATGKVVVCFQPLVPTA